MGAGDWLRNAHKDLVWGGGGGCCGFVVGLGGCWSGFGDRVAGWTSFGFGIWYWAAVAGWKGRVRTGERVMKKAGCRFGDVKCGGLDSCGSGSCENLHLIQPPPRFWPNF